MKAFNLGKTFRAAVRVIRNGDVRVLADLEQVTTITTSWDRDGFVEKVSFTAPDFDFSELVGDTIPVTIAAPDTLILIFEPARPILSELLTVNIEQHIDGDPVRKYMLINAALSRLTVDKVTKEIEATFKSSVVIE